MKALIVGILVVLVLVIAGIAGYIYFLPPVLRLEKKSVVAAPIDTTYEVASKLSGWPDWWKSGAIGGKGRMVVGGAKEGGVGSKLTLDIPGAPVDLEIKSLTPPKEIEMSVTADVYVFRLVISLAPDPAGTALKMTMDRNMTYGEKAFEWVTGGLTKVLGGRMATGLGELQHAAEEASK